MIVKFVIFIFYIFQFVFGEIRTLFPRKTVICYGLSRFFGETGCKITLTILMTYVLIEFFFILYALNGQYNTICKKTSFHENNKLQKISLFSILIFTIAFFSMFMLSFISREEAISQIYMNYSDTKSYINGSYVIIAVGESKIDLFIGVVSIGLIKTFLPRKTVICYGLSRFFGETGCQIATLNFFLYYML
uniref:G-protein coupled receptors family 1 profile domain-containing protein n=1 Tax=Strongyloides stercoralis TaxID=6248 RepID=A0A0K0EB75_STRER